MALALAKGFISTDTFRKENIFASARTERTLNVWKVREVSPSSDHLPPTPLGKVHRTTFRRRLGEGGLPGGILTVGNFDMVKIPTLGQSQMSECQQWGN